jgi:hypothetical protein
MTHGILFVWRTHDPVEHTTSLDGVWFELRSHRPVNWTKPITSGLHFHFPDFSIAFLSREWHLAIIILSFYVHQLALFTLPLIMHRTAVTRMSSAITVGLGLLGAGLGGRVLWQAYRGGARAGADKWVKGGFQAKMDKNEAMKILGVK